MFNIFNYYYIWLALHYQIKRLSDCWKCFLKAWRVRSCICLCPFIDPDRVSVFWLVLFNFPLKSSQSSALKFIRNILFHNSVEWTLSLNYYHACNIWWINLVRTASKSYHAIKHGNVSGTEMFKIFDFDVILSTIQIPHQSNVCPIFACTKWLQVVVQATTEPITIILP